MFGRVLAGGGAFVPVSLRATSQVNLLVNASIGFTQRFMRGKGPKGFKRGQAEWDLVKEDTKKLTDLQPGEVHETYKQILYRVQVPRDKVQVKFSRSSGPGGQNVNKVEVRA
jgi:hypothetical protein